MILTPPAARSTILKARGPCVLALPRSGRERLREVNRARAGPVTPPRGTHRPRLRSLSVLSLDHCWLFGNLGSPRTTATFVSPPQRVWLRRALTRERAVLPYPVTARRKHQLRHRRTRNRGCELSSGGGGRHLVHRLALPLSSARFKAVGRQLTPPRSFESQFFLTHERTL